MSRFTQTFNDGNTRAQIVTSDPTLRFGAGAMKVVGLVTLGAMATGLAPFAVAGLAIGLTGYGVGTYLQAESTETVPAGQRDVQSNTPGLGKRILQFANPLKF